MQFERYLEFQLLLNPQGFFFFSKLSKYPFVRNYKHLHHLYTIERSGCLLKVKLLSGQAIDKTRWLSMFSFFYLIQLNPLISSLLTIPFSLWLYFLYDYSNQ